MGADEQALGVLLVFARIGACLMVVPGLSTARVPARVRLFLSVALAFVIAPVLEPAEHGRGGAGPGLLPVIFGECLAGWVVGLGARLLLEALEFAGAAISNYIGLSSVAGGIQSNEPAPTVSTMISVTATLILMLLDFPQHLVSILVESYAVMPLGDIPQPSNMLRQFMSLLSAAFVMGFQVTGPFLVYGIILHAMFAILGKLVPQVQSYFLSGPFLALGGLGVLYLMIGEMNQIFADAVLVEMQRL